MGRVKREIKQLKSEKSRLLTFQKRKKGLEKKISELVTLCGISAGMICYGPKRSRFVGPHLWPDSPDMKRILMKYSSISKPEREKRMLRLSDFSSNKEEEDSSYSMEEIKENTSNRKENISKNTSNDKEGLAKESESVLGVGSSSRSSIDLLQELVLLQSASGYDGSFVKKLQEMVKKLESGPRDDSSYVELLQELIRKLDSRLAIVQDRIKLLKRESLDLNQPCFNQFLSTTDMCHDQENAMEETPTVSGMYEKNDVAMEGRRHEARNLPNAWVLVDDEKNHKSMDGIQENAGKNDKSIDGMKEVFQETAGKNDKSMEGMQEGIQENAGRNEDLMEEIREYSKKDDNSMEEIQDDAPQLHNQSLLNSYKEPSKKKDSSMEGIPEHAAQRNKNQHQSLPNSSVESSNQHISIVQEPGSSAVISDNEPTGHGNSSSSNSNAARQIPSKGGLRFRRSARLPPGLLPVMALLPMDHGPSG